MNSCYLCEGVNFSLREGEVRDAPTMKILECNDCGLVSLDSVAHIHSSFYENSGMHGEHLTPMEDWLKETSWDDQRRFEQLKPLLPNKRVLDFGCGAGGFLSNAKSLVADAVGVELEARVVNHWKDSDLVILPSIEEAASSLSGRGYDIITAFHVVEHLPDPREVLTKLGVMLKSNGRIIIEVPSADDALLTLYKCNAFQHFTYWSQHLFLFTAHTLELLALQAGLRVVAVQNYQRYPLSNHLHWLSRGRPGGHQSWAFLDAPELKSAYANTLAALGKTDTLIVHLERRD